MRNKFLLFSFFAFNTFLAYSQVKSCGEHTMTKKLYDEHPEVLKEVEILNKKGVSTTKSYDSTTVFRIPVVFHIIHEYGTENISDAQVHDAIRIMNLDYSKLNADTAAVVPAFQNLIGDAKIDFRLATIDPLGNCTNGIIHHYSHLTNEGDDYTKLQQWNRSKYLNVWVVKTMASVGTAGYTYKPDNVDGSFFWSDGIVILDDYIGSIGTGSVGQSRALTHEVGHWLTLSHTWGNTNDPEVACGDDGIDDTPETEGHYSCVLGDQNCNPGITENVQNFMEYSYCSNMFTKDQIRAIRFGLQSETADRSSLWTAENLVATGTNYEIGSMPACKPVADFFVDKQNVCIGDAVTFSNFTHGMVPGDVATYSWTFQNGTPSTSTATSPSVTFNSPGWKVVTLTATNAQGSHTKTEQKLVYVHGEWAEFTGPKVQNFDSGSDFWISQNPENNYTEFVKSYGTGKSGSNCYVLTNYRDISNAIPFSDESFHTQRLGGTEDFLISPAFDLRNTTSVQVSFDYALGVSTLNTDEISDEIVVYSSKDCGNTWSVRKTINFNSNPSVLTAGYVGPGNFIPANDALWKNVSFSYPANSTDANTRFRIKFTASDYSNNFYFDNFNVTGTLGLEENITSLIEVSPNPVQTGSSVNVSIPSTDENLTIELVDINGALISTESVSANSGAQTVSIQMNVAQGIYFLNAIKGNEKTTRRVVVQ